ncbi:hypothetical protein OH76DRAFT_1411240 [Lentinus brumalis]|uniref:DUF6534 domain-containing protein n=1 Tax=Lentinus brumalis TaxID=2498619 RepID=A0A371CPZ3_9APHY|nr:hypothetical protein OH76DRAFT_1411240 [Polyporus brumalis]
MDAVPSPPMDLPAIDNTVGAWLIGTFIGLILQGVGYNQVYHYCCLYPHDSRWLKTWVLLVTAVETANSVVAMHACYYNLVVNYGNTAISTAAPPWYIYSESLSDIVTDLSLVSAPSSTCRLGCRPHATLLRPSNIQAQQTVQTHSHHSGNPSSCIQRLYDRCDSSNMECARCPDHPAVLLAGVHGMRLDPGRRYLADNKFNLHPAMPSRRIHPVRYAACHVMLLTIPPWNISTDSMLDVICMYTVSSGLIVCVSNAMSVAFAVTWPENLIYAGNVMVATKLYSNTFLASLNARQSLANHGVTVVDAETMQFRSHIMKIPTQPDRSLGLRRTGVPLTEHVHGSSITQSDCTAIEMKVMPHDLSASDTVNIPHFAREDSGEKDFIHVS